MPLIDLSKLRTGDLILETGIPRVASATGGCSTGAYGHASVALGRLVRIEAGKEMGVEANLFDVREWRKGNDRLIGICVGEEVVVRRPRATLEVGDIVSRAIGEVGRDYAGCSDLLRMQDLTLAARKFLTKRAAGEKARQEAEGQTSRQGRLSGRYCSEVAAILLGIEPTDVSPNELASAPELDDVPELIVPTKGWRCVGGPKALQQAEEELAKLGKPIVETWNHVRTCASDVGRGASAEEKAELVEELDCMIDLRIRESLEAIVRIHRIEALVFS